MKGTTTGTATDIDGNYSLQVQQGAMLTFSYVGMQPKEVKVSSDRIDVALIEDNLVCSKTSWSWATACRKRNS